MRRLVISLWALGAPWALAALLAACTQTPADEAISICEPLCHCTAVPLPSAQRACTTTCVTEFETNPLSVPCIDCVIAHENRCTTLMNDCNPICSQGAPLPAYGGPLMSSMSSESSEMSSESRFDR